MSKKRIALIIGASVMGLLALLCVVGAVGEAMEENPKPSPSHTVSPSITKTPTPEPTVTRPTTTAPTPSRTTTAPPIIGLKSSPKPRKATVEPEVEEEYYSTCTELRRDHPGGVSRSHPAYRSGLDRDKDGRACEIN